MDIEEKLVQYRKKKRRNQKINDFKTIFKSFLMLGTGHMDESDDKSDTAISIPEDESKKFSKITEIILPAVEDIAFSTDDENSVEMDADHITVDTQNSYKYILWTVYILFWITLYIIAIELQFGLVFLLLSALFGIYFNTRTGPKNRNEMSAYSVFNKNCESIDGALTAEQFEREMRYGAGSVM